jgi:hypothetical protein
MLTASQEWQTTAWRGDDYSSQTVTDASTTTIRGNLFHSLYKPSKTTEFSTLT